jgi:hypothetical protein
LEPPKDLCISASPRTPAKSLSISGVELTQRLKRIQDEYKCQIDRNAPHHVQKALLTMMCCFRLDAAMVGSRCLAVVGEQFSQQGSSTLCPPLSLELDVHQLVCSEDAGVARIAAKQIDAKTRDDCGRFAIIG